MIERAKKHRLIYAIIGGASFALGIILAAVVFILILGQNYFPMWFFLGFSVLFFNATPFLAFAAVDRNTAIRVIKVIEECGSADKKTVARALNWKVKATARFLRKCKKWGYIQTSK